MNKPLKIIGAISLFAGAGAASFFTLTAIEPQRVEPSQSLPNTTAQSDASNIDQLATVDQTTTPTKTDDVSDTTTDEAKIATMDTTVKNTLGNLTASFNNYTSANRGAMPTTSAQLANFKASYISYVDLNNPVTNSDYSIELNAQPTADIIAFQPGFKCADEAGTTVVQGTSRQFAVSVILPSGQFYCIGS